MDNRRQHDRIAYRQTVHVKLYSVADHPELKNREIQANTSDISEGGVRFICDRNLAVGTRVKLRISIDPPPSHFIHSGEVKWSNKIPEKEGQYYAGIQFTEASSTHTMEWVRLIRQMTRSPASSTSPGIIPMDD